ncbi:MAG: InlB B-repeat-containing protein, partial [Clostridia bacterium]|nr:InlB B-repeat-containing protein [Clostridia bacterium]
MDAYNHYKGTFYTFAQVADTVLPIVQANGGTSLTGNSSDVNNAIWADAVAKADVLNSTGEGGLRADAPITKWLVSGSTWSGVEGYSMWKTPAGDIVNVRVQAGNVAYPYTIAFTITEDAVAEGGIYVTVHTYNMTGGDMRLVKNIFYQNNAGAIAESVQILDSVDVTGSGYTTFYIETAGDYTIVANDPETQEGITGIFFDKSEPIPAGQSLGFDDVSKAKWEGTYGDAGYVIYAGTSNDTRYVYTKNIFDGDSDGAYSQLDAWPVSTDNASKESNYHPFKVSGADPDGTIISQFNDQTYLIKGDQTSASGLYKPGTTTANKYMPKSSSSACQSAVAFYVPAEALATAKAETGNSVIYVTMYIPGESAARTADATNTVSLIYTPSSDVTKIAPRALISGSDTNSDGGLLQYNKNQSSSGLRSSSATILATKTYSFSAGDTNGIYATFELNTAGYYAIQTLDTVERGTWSGVFFDYNKPEAPKSLTVDLADGSTPTVYEFKSTSTDITLEAPTRFGYTFAGWSVDGADPVKEFTLDCSEATANVSVVAVYDEIQLAAGIDSSTRANWEGTYGNAGYIIYAGKDTTNRYIYHKGIYAGYDESTYSQLSAFDMCDPAKCTSSTPCTHPSTIEAMHRDFRVDGLDPDGTVISAFASQSYLTRGDTTASVGLYIPGTTNANKYITKAASPIMQAAAAFYVPAEALANSTSGVIYVSMYTPGTAATRNAGDTVTTNFFYSDSANLDDLLTNATYDDIHGSTTNTAVGILNSNKKVTTQVYEYAEGEVNGVYHTFVITAPGYYAIQTLDSEENSSWSGVFFDYNKPEAPNTLSVDKADGSEIENINFFSYSDDITLETPSRVGYTFTGWSIDGADPVMEFTLDCSAVETNVSAVATWTPNVYNINVNLDGGEADIPATYTIESTIVLPTPERTGFDFAGWKINGADAVMEYTIASGSTGDIDLVATWTVRKNTITYVVGDYGTLDSNTQLIGVGEDYALYIPTITNISKVFAGWKIESTDEIIATTGVWTIDGDVTLVAVYNDVQLAVSTDGSTGANWEEAYGNAGYIIYAGNSATDRYIYHKGIYAGYDESTYSQLSPFDICTNEADCTQEAMHRDFRVDGADPSGTIISAFGDQTYGVKDDTVSSDGLYIPGTLTLNKYFTRSSNAGATAQTAVAFYVPETALTTSTTGTIYVSMYLPGEAATRNAGDSVTAHLFYSNSDNLDTLLGRSTYDDQHGSTTNSAAGILNASKKVASQTHTFAEGDPNGVYMTFAINAPGYYAIQGADSEARVGWSGIFFDYERPVPNVSATSHVSTVKYGDANFDADRIGRYGDEYYLIAATADETDSNRKTGAVDSNMYTPDAYVDGLVPVKGTSGVGGVTGLLNPLTGGFKTDIPVRNVYVNTYIRSITSPYGVALADGTQSNSLFKGNGTGIAGFTFEVYTNETIYVTAYFAQEKEYLVDGTTPYTFDIDVNLYKNTAFFDCAPANVPSNANFPKVAKLLQTVEVNGMNGAYVTFAITGKGIYFLAEDFTQYSEGGNIHVAPQALYVSTSEPVAKNALTVDLAGGEATLELPKYFDATTADITLPTPVKAGYDFAGWSVNGAPAVMEYTLDCSEATGSVNAVATWTPTVYNINVNLNGGEATIPATYTIEDTIVIPAPEKANYVFVGWLVNGAEDTVDSYTIASGSTGDISLVAVWTGVTYTHL